MFYNLVVVYTRDISVPRMGMLVKQLAAMVFLRSETFGDFSRLYK
jgi:hypothetical protein